MSQRNPSEQLAIFDNLDMEEPEERRVALFILNDYFGAIFGEVGEQLDFRTSDYTVSVGSQWDKASSRLEMIDSVDIPGEYHGTLNTINGLRGNYAHDFRDYPPKEPLTSAREVAPEWADWIRNAAEAYEEYQESLTASEALIQVGERVIAEHNFDWRNYPREFYTRAKALESQVESLEDELESFREEDGVTNELVDAIADIMDWERDKKELDDRVRNWEKEEEERLEREDRANNTYQFIVQEVVEEYNSIEIVKHHPGEPADAYSVTISECPISDEEMDYLRSLDSDDEVRLWMGTNTIRGRNGRFEYQDIIKGVVDMEESTETTASVLDW